MTSLPFSDVDIANVSAPSVLLDSSTLAFSSWEASSEAVDRLEEDGRLTVEDEDEDGRSCRRTSLFSLYSLALAVGFLARSERRVSPSKTQVKSMKKKDEVVE